MKQRSLSNVIFVTTSFQKSRPAQKSVMNKHVASEHEAENLSNVIFVTTSFH
jgi:hypothetical protein